MHTNEYISYDQQYICLPVCIFMEKDVCIYNKTKYNCKKLRWERRGQWERKGGCTAWEGEKGRGREDGMDGK